MFKTTPIEVFTLETIPRRVLLFNSSRSRLTSGKVSLIKTTHGKGLIFETLLGTASPLKPLLGVFHFSK